jgi:hypothetical protein
MKTQEQKLDAEFAKLGVKPYIYHFFPPGGTITAVTIASPEPRRWAVVAGIIETGIAYYQNNSAHNNALMSFMLYWLDGHEMQGAAICGLRDNFDRQLGRVIAKGRLLKHLRKEEAEKR